MSSTKPAQRPKKGIPLLIPPKPVLFKKMAQQKMTETSKQAKTKRAQEKAAEIIKGLDGFFEVSVQYGLCKDLADGLGLKDTDVTQALAMDNQQRKLGSPSQASHVDEELEEEGLDLDFDSDEDLLSEEEEPNQA